MIIKCVLRMPTELQLKMHCISSKCLFKIIITGHDGLALPLFSIIDLLCHSLIYAIGHKLTWVTAKICDNLRLLCCILDREILAPGTRACSVDQT